MPAVFFEDGYRFFFYFNEGSEPPHVHVEKGDAVGKWWLSDLSMDHQEGFKKGELRTIGRILQTRRQEILDAWDEHFK